MADYPPGTELRARIDAAAKAIQHTALGLAQNPGISPSDYVTDLGAAIEAALAVKVELPPEPEPERSELFMTKGEQVLHRWAVSDAERLYQVEERLRWLQLPRWRRVRQAPPPIGPGTFK